MNLQIIRPVYDPIERGFGPYISFAAVFAILHLAELTSAMACIGTLRAAPGWKKCI